MIVVCRRSKDACVKKSCLSQVLRLPPLTPPPSGGTSIKVTKEPRPPSLPPSNPNPRSSHRRTWQGQKSQFCSAHKQEGQVDVCNRRCQQPGCSKRPCFGRPGQRPSFCGTHRSPDMVDVISHKCAYPGCSHPTGHEGNRTRSKFCGKAIDRSIGRSGVGWGRDDVT